MHNHPGLAISRRDICLILRNACEKVANMEKEKHTFQAPAIHPLNPDVFPMRIFSHQKSLMGPKKTNKELKMPIEKIAAENNTCANSLVKKSPSEGDEEEP
jgi:hypothetical protein